MHGVRALSREAQAGSLRADSDAETGRPDFLDGVRLEVMSDQLGDSPQKWLDGDHRRLLAPFLSPDGLLNGGRPPALFQPAHLLACCTLFAALPGALPGTAHSLLCVLRGVGWGRQREPLGVRRPGFSRQPLPPTRPGS